jgi:lysophospholipase L1-like esterase
MIDEHMDAQGLPERKSCGRGTIIAVGDSLTAGFGVAGDQAYPALLERKLWDEGYDYRVINAGINGGSIRYFHSFRISSSSRQAPTMDCAEFPPSR